MQRLAGATLLVFANKQDLPGALSKDAIQEVATTEQFPWYSQVMWPLTTARPPTGAGPGRDQEPPLVHHRLQRGDWWELANGSGLVTGRHCSQDLHCRVMEKVQTDPEPMNRSNLGFEELHLECWDGLTLSKRLILGHNFTSCYLCSFLDTFTLNWGFKMFSQVTCVK